MNRRPKKSAAFEHFSLNKALNSFVCQVEKNDEKCNRKLSAYSASKEGHMHAPTRASNLKRHLKRKHPDIYKSVEEKDNEVQEPSTSFKSAAHQVPVTKYFHAESVTISMNAENFKKHLINLVVKNGVALSLFSSPAFRGLNGEMAEKFGVSLERQSIRNMIIIEAEKQKDVLKKMLHGKCFFLKIDTCTRQRVNYIAVNVQFVNDEKKIVIYTLAVRDTEAHHSSEDIREIVEEILKEFEIKKEQILSIVTDNASSMVKAVKLLNEDEGDGDEVEEPEDCSEDLSSKALGESVSSAAMDFVSLTDVLHMRCAAHTLQLAIRDGLKERHVANVIARLRNIAVAARTPTLDSILKRRAGKGAIIDQATRWGSTYEMIQRLLELQPYLTDMANPDVTMPDIQWEEAKQLEKLLYHAYSVTKQFQAAELTPGLFVKEWKSLTYKLAQIGVSIADGIRRSMIRREELLLDNSVLLAAIYIDPMYRIILTEEQKTRGKSALSDIAVKMKMLKDGNNFFVSETTGIHPSSSSDSEEMDFEKFLDLEEKSKGKRLDDSSSQTQSPLTKFRLEFTDALVEMEKIDRKSRLNVLEAIPKYPAVVQDVARTVTALPPTQVSVERLFSALRIIKTYLHSKLKEDITEAILFLRTNSN